MAYHEHHKFLFGDMDDDPAYCLGVYLGDGYVYLKDGAYKVCLATKDEDFADEFRKRISRVLNCPVNKIINPTLNRKTGQALIYRISVGSNSFAKWLKEVTKSKTVIPFNLIEGKERSFLQAIMDSEGSIIKL